MKTGFLGFYEMVDLGVTHCRRCEYFLTALEIGLPVGAIGPHPMHRRRTYQQIVVFLKGQPTECAIETPHSPLFEEVQKISSGIPTHILAEF